MQSNFQEKLKKYNKYIKENEVFIPDKILIGELIAGFIFIVLSQYWISWLIYIGIVLVALAAIDYFRRQGHIKGFLVGYDEGYNDACEIYEKEKE